VYIGNGNSGITEMPEIMAQATVMLGVIGNSSNSGNGNSGNGNSNTNNGNRNGQGKGSGQNPKDNGKYQGWDKDQFKQKKGNRGKHLGWYKRGITRKNSVTCPPSISRSPMRLLTMSRMSP